MKKVTAYQTSDGRTFTNELEALENEQKIELRGIIQSNPRFRSNAKGESIELAHIIHILLQNHDELNALMKRYKGKIAGCKKRNEAITVSLR